MKDVNVSNPPEGRLNKLCTTCGKAELGAPTLETVSYASLPGTRLEGIEVRRCPRCGDQELSYPRLEQLHLVLAHELAHKPGRLTGPEVRFLRIQLGWTTGTKFAERFATEPATVSRWETGTQRMDIRAELLLRVLATRLEPVAAHAELEPLLARPRQDERPVGRDLRFDGVSWVRSRATA